MPQAQRRVAGRGVSMTQWRVASPLCAPSRATLLTGRHLHNLASATSTPASEEQFRNFSGGRGHLDLGVAVWPHIFATRLRDERGYETGLFGKCMNGGCGEESDTGGLNLRNERPFSRWFESVRGDPGSTTFFDSESPGCSWREGEGYSGECIVDTGAHTAGQGYSTSEIGNATLRWLGSLSAAASTIQQRRPWLAIVAVEAPKLLPAPWHWQDGRPIESSPCVGAYSPRLPSWNYTGQQRLSSAGCGLATPPAPQVSDGGDEFQAGGGGGTFHELIACQPPLTQREAAYIDRLARRRCTSMMAVDDTLGEIMNEIEREGELNTTYVLMTSDHGFTLGHHGLPREKGLLYEHNLRVPMLISGPGIARAVSSSFLGSHVDVAPTLLGMAGLDKPAWMDGSSLVPLLVTRAEEAPRPVWQHVMTARQQEQAQRSSSRVSNADGDASLLAPELASRRVHLVLHYNQGCTRWAQSSTAPFVASSSGTISPQPLLPPPHLS